MRGVISIHRRDYELFCGYMSPNDLIAMAHVPSFEEDTSHQIIAVGLKDPPIDNWQRPLEILRLERIRQKIDSAEAANRDKDSLMANPVLIGKSDKIGNRGVSLDIEQHQITVDRRTVNVEDVYKINMTSRGASKPLWILDGQHRIHGLGNSPRVTDDFGNPTPNGSIVQDEKIPVVFVLADAFTPKFLAKIFTEVTTEAQKLDSVHGDWMQFAFSMGDYSDESARKAMKATILIATEQYIDGDPNEFCADGSQIKFNPNLDINGVGSIRLDAPTFRKLIEERYYRIGGAANDLELATAFIRFYRAASALDADSNMGSRLLSSDDPLPALAKEFFGSFLEYLSDNAALVANTEAQWTAFLGTPERQFGASNWKLPDVSAGSTQANRAFNASKRAMKATFSKFFSTPEDFDGDDPASWLWGPGMIQVQTAPLGLRFPSRRYVAHEQIAAGGMVTVNIRGDNHKMIRFRDLVDSQASVVQISRKEGRDWVPIRDKNAAITLEPGNNSEIIRVHVICFSLDSETTTDFKFIS